MATLLDLGEFGVPPPARGWSPDDMTVWITSAGSPASAGMVPVVANCGSIIERFPRQRGDGPPIRNCFKQSLQVPPPARGWSPPKRRNKSLNMGSPASAGMVRSSW